MPENMQRTPVVQHTPATVRYEPLFRLEGYMFDVLAIAYSHDTIMLASGSSDKIVRLWSSEVRRTPYNLESCIHHAPCRQARCCGASAATWRRFTPSTFHPMGKACVYAYSILRQQLT
jgi:hypothetical protein